VTTVIPTLEERKRFLDQLGYHVRGHGGQLRIVGEVPVEPEPAPETDAAEAPPKRGSIVVPNYTDRAREEFDALVAKEKTR
jgi:hypothetical protein